MSTMHLPAPTDRAISHAVASTSATTVVGGGETVQALRRFCLQDRVNHLSAGGPAMLEFLEGHALPGVEVLLRDAGVSPSATRQAA